MDNLRLYLMQISQMMGQIAIQTQNLGAVVSSMDERIAKLEARCEVGH